MEEELRAEILEKAELLYDIPGRNRKNLFLVKPVSVTLEGYMMKKR